MSLATLYGDTGTEPGGTYTLSSGDIIDNTDPDYYDLKDPSGNILCMDGESCTVSEVYDDGSVDLLNKEGESETYFTLTSEEAGTALFIHHFDA